MFASGALDSMIGTMMGSSEEWIPVMTGAFGDFCFLSNALGQALAGFLFLELVKTDAKKVFQLSTIFLALWMPLLYMMFAKGIMGVPGVAQYGSIMVVSLGIQGYTLNTLGGFA
jgi:hypothetical protein